MKRVGIIALTMASLGTQAFATWNLANEFSVTNGNPNDVWSYGMKLDPNHPEGALSLFPNGGASADWLWWNDPGHISLGAPAVTKNISGGPMNGVASGEVSFHPGQNGELATIRFTAQTATNYHFTGHYGAGDGGTVDALIYSGNTPLFAQNGITGNTSFDFSLDLLAGQSVDVMVGNAGSFFYDSTPIELQINAVPEPASLTPIAIGLALIAKRRAAKRK